LSDGVVVTSGGGYGFGPRHLDFHPTQPWIYVSMERQNKLYVYSVQGDALSPEPLYRKDTLADLRNHRPGQLAGAIHVHPGGRFVYVSNRASSTVEFEGKQVFSGGENSIAVYAIDQKTGEPTLIQQADTRGLHPRTFTIDPSGRMLVVANLQPLAVRDGSGINVVPACLSVFRIGGDGKLDYVRKYDIDVGGNMMFWSGMVQR
jgi:6-phosphogluconolactonase (cycloisomerase 2 family)